MIWASLNRGSRLGPKTSVQGKPCPSLGTWKFYKCFSISGGKILVFFKKNVEFLEFLAFTLRFRRFQAKKILIIFFLTDRKISSSNYVVFPILKRYIKQKEHYATKKKIQGSEALDPSLGLIFPSQGLTLARQCIILTYNFVAAAKFQIEIRHETGLD